MTMPRIGFTHPDRMSEPMPAFAMAAPANPPSSACEEELGNPTYQVTRFHTMAPSRAARTTVGSTIAGSTRPLLIVFATAVPTVNAAMKLKNAAHATATPGESTRVETTVAIELALSWKPLMKSKTRATATIRRTKLIESGMGQPCLMATDSSVLLTSSALSRVFSSLS